MASPIENYSTHTLLKCTCKKRGFYKYGLSTIMFKFIKKKISLILLRYTLSHDNWSARRKAHEVVKIIRNKKLSDKIYSSAEMMMKFHAVGVNIGTNIKLIQLLILELRKDTDIRVQPVYIETKEIFFRNFFTEGGYYVDIQANLDTYLDLCDQLCQLTEPFDNIYAGKGYINMKLINLYKTTISVGEILLINDFFE